MSTTAREEWLRKRQLQEAADPRTPEERREQKRQRLLAGLSPLPPPGPVSPSPIPDPDPEELSYFVYRRLIGVADTAPRRRRTYVPSTPDFEPREYCVHLPEAVLKRLFDEDAYGENE